MADQIMTAGSELSALVPELWSAKFYDALEELFPFNSLVNRSYEGEIKNLGDIVNISTLPYADAATELAEGAKADADAITATNTQLVINTMAVKDFIITRRGDLQSIEFMDKMRDVAVHALMEKLQDDIISAFVPSASAPDHSIAYDSGSTLALADLLEAKELLDEQSVPQEGRHFCVGSAQYNDLYNVSSFVSKDFIPAGSPVTSGKFETQLAGFMPHLCIAASNTTYLFHESFMEMAIQDELTVQRDSLLPQGKRAERISSHVLYGIKLMDSKRCVTIG